MYTIKGFLVEDGSAAMLASAKDWDEALEKAAQFRKQAVVVEIWNDNGIKFTEPEINPSAKTAMTGLHGYGQLSTNSTYSQRRSRVAKTSPRLAM